MTDVANRPVEESLVHREPRWLLCAVSFWGGLQIMVLEMCGFKVLQTNLGSSVLVTGTLLTSVMVLLSLGYYAGGRLHTRFRNARALFGLLILAALYTEVVTTILLEPIGTLSLALHTALGPHPYLRAMVPAGVLTSLLYGPPVFLTSMISPYWVGVETMNDADRRAAPGLESGFFMALSTVGSIVGTLLASYLLIPFVGPATSARGSNAVFLVLVLAGWLWAASSTPAAWLMRTVARLIIVGLVMSGLSLVLVQRPTALPGTAPNYDAAFSR